MFSFLKTKYIFCVFCALISSTLYCQNKIIKGVGKASVQNRGVEDAIMIAIENARIDALGKISIIYTSDSEFAFNDDFKSKSEFASYVQKISFGNLERLDYRVKWISGENMEFKSVEVEADFKLIEDDYNKIYNKILNAFKNDQQRIIFDKYISAYDRQIELLNSIEKSIGDEYSNKIDLFRKNLKELSIVENTINETIYLPNEITDGVQESISKQIELADYYIDRLKGVLSKKTTLFNPYISKHPEIKPLSISQKDNYNIEFSLEISFMESPLIEEFMNLNHNICLNNELQAYLIPNLRMVEKSNKNFFFSIRYYRSAIAVNDEETEKELFKDYRKYNTRKFAVQYFQFFDCEIVFYDKNNRVIKREIANIKDKGVVKLSLDKLFFPEKFQVIDERLYESKIYDNRNRYIKDKNNYKITTLISNKEFGQIAYFSIIPINTNKYYVLSWSIN